MMRRRGTWLGVAVLAVAFAVATTSNAYAQKEEKKGEKKLKVGDKFPDVAVAVTDVKKVLGKEKKNVKISDLKGKTVVVWFFPKAMTGG